MPLRDALARIPVAAIFLAGQLLRHVVHGRLGVEPGTMAVAMPQRSHALARCLKHAALPGTTIMTELRPEVVGNVGKPLGVCRPPGQVAHYHALDRAPRQEVAEWLVRLFDDVAHGRQIRRSHLDFAE